MEGALNQDGRGRTLCEEGGCTLCEEGGCTLCEEGGCTLCLVCALREDRKRAHCVRRNE